MCEVVVAVNPSSCIRRSCVALRSGMSVARASLFPPFPFCCTGGCSRTEYSFSLESRDFSHTFLAPKTTHVTFVLSWTI